MRRIATFCGVCLAMSAAAASGAQLRSSSSADSALNETSAASLVAGRQRQNPDVPHAISRKGPTAQGTVKRIHRSHAAQVLLVGRDAIEPTVGHNLAGTVEAFAFRARRSGTAASINVYLNTHDRATTLFAGLYSSRQGHPESLLTSGLLRSPKTGRWNSVPVGPASLRAGATYWLAVLGKGGAFYFRDRDGGSCTGEGSFMSKVRSLPRTWPAGPRLHACLISAYVKGAARSTKVFGINAPPGTTSNAAGSTTATSAPTQTAASSTPAAAGPSLSAVTTSNVTDTSATFTATINPNGIATTVAFEYGTTTGYGATSPTQSIGSGTTPQTVTTTVIGLTPGATYHVRVEAIQ